MFIRRYNVAPPSLEEISAWKKFLAWKRILASRGIKAGRALLERE